MTKRVLISVTDKTGLEKFGALAAAGWKIISTGGTARRLAELGIPFVPIEEFTGMPEMMDGRLKTLHPKVLGGILADLEKQEHQFALTMLETFPIDLVVVNLYDFANNPGIKTSTLAAHRSCGRLPRTTHTSAWSSIQMTTIW